MIAPDDIQGVKGALLRYRIIAWIVGILLVLLMCVALPIKFFTGDGSAVTWTGLPHGWLYMVLLICAYDLGRRVGWNLWWFLGIMAAGTVPFLTFFAEHKATADVKRKLAEAEQAAATSTVLPAEG